jgi:hypothetical protein
LTLKDILTKTAKLALNENVIIVLLLVGGSLIFSSLLVAQVSFLVSKLVFGCGLSIVVVTYCLAITAFIINVVNDLNKEGP